MKKIIIVLCLFLTAGCDIKYNLDIDENIKEDISILGNYDYDDYFLYQIYRDKPIPLTKNYTIQPESNEKIEGVAYYNKSDLSNDNDFGLNFKAKFNSSNYNDSTILSVGIGKNVINPTDDFINIDLPSDFKVFKQYPDLEMITLNIKSKYSILENNADKIDKNVYTWYITPDYGKNIKMKIKTSNVLQDIEKNTKNDPMIRFSIVIFIIVIIGIIIYYLVRKKYKKNNSL